MDEKKISFISCVNDEKMYNECKLYIKSLKVPEDFKVELIAERNAKSMCSGYNSAIMKTNAKYKVFLHQDVLIVNKNFIYDVVEIFADKSINVIGMIGCINLPKSGVWWDGMRQYGRVLHACEPESVVDSHCNEPEGKYQEVEAVDGFLMATQNDVKFREDLFDGWHFYDTSFCKENGRLGYKIVVPNQSADFWCIHCPKEKPLEKSYKKYQKIFLGEYGEELTPEV